MRILVVDDNRDILDLLQRLLLADGHDVVTARDGREALQQEAAARPDLVVLDVNLPFVNGWELCRRIKARRIVPVVLLTVRAEHSDYERSRDAGADDHLVKPFDIAEFLQRIERLAPTNRASRPSVIHPS
jgi:DNA-binding response OmpR family regulator